MPGHLALEAVVQETILPRHAEMEGLAPALPESSDALRRLVNGAREEATIAGHVGLFEMPLDPLKMAIGCPQVLVFERRVYALEPVEAPPAGRSALVWRTGEGHLVARLRSEMSLERIAAQFMGIVVQKLFRAHCEAEAARGSPSDVPSVKHLRQAIERRRREAGLPGSGVWLAGPSRRIARAEDGRFRLERFVEPAALELMPGAPWLYALPECWVGVTLHDDDPSSVPQRVQGAARRARGHALPRVRDRPRRPGEAGAGGRAVRLRARAPRAQPHVRGSGRALVEESLARRAGLQPRARGIARIETGDCLAAGVQDPQPPCEHSRRPGGVFKQALAW